MALVGLLCADEEDRRKVALAAGETGHLVHGAGELADAVELLRERRPRLMIVVDGPGSDGASLVRELRRAAPLLPIVVLQRVRDASRAVSLLRAGAAEVVAPPWTREHLEACLSKSLRFQGTALALLTPRPRRAAPLFWILSIAFLVGSLLYSDGLRRERLRQAAVPTLNHWDLPYKHPAGLAFDDGRLWIADWFTQSIYQHAMPDRALARVVHFPAETPTAFTLGSDNAWVASAAGITRRMKDAKLTELARFPGLERRSVGLAFDGLYLWSLSSNGRALRKHLPDQNLSVIATYKYPGLAGAALVWDGRSLWSLDAGHRELVRHNLERPDEPVERVSLPEYGDGRFRPVGLGWDGERFWTVAERLPRSSGSARLFRHLERFVPGAR